MITTSYAITRARRLLAAAVLAVALLGAIGAPTATATPNLDASQPSIPAGISPAARLNLESSLPSSPASGAARSNLVSGGRHSSVSVPPTVVRVHVQNQRGFDWGDAGIGAGGVLALTMIGLGGTLVASTRRNRRSGLGYGSTAKGAQS
jgi:hypothetical protein